MAKALKNEKKCDKRDKRNKRDKRQRFCGRHKGGKGDLRRRCRPDISRVPRPDFTLLFSNRHTGTPRGAGFCVVSEAYFSGFSEAYFYFMQYMHEMKVGLAKPEK